MGGVGGVAHPPGYPLFALWSRLWAWLPAAPTHRVALATAVTGALGVFLMERACRAWGARPLAATVATAMFALSPLAWRLATVPEVFTLNIAIAMALVLASSPERVAREDLRAPLLALLAGLGLSNHHTIVFLAPVGLLAWSRAVARSERHAFSVLTSLGALGLGLLPYAYLPLAAGSECAWGDTTSLRGVLHHFFRVDYGTTELAATHGAREPLAQLAWLAQSFLESGIAVGVVTALVVLTRRRSWSWSLAALLLALLVAGPVFVTRFNLPPRGLMASIVVRFHLLPLALGAVLGARGIDVWVEVVRTPLARRLALAATFALGIARGTISGADVITSHRPTTERYLRNVFAFLPSRSILLVADDDTAGGFQYMQCGLGERPDVVVIVPPLMLGGWYADRVDAKLGFPAARGIVHPGDSVPTLEITTLIDQLVESERPVYVTKWPSATLERSFPSYPIGPLLRVSPRRSALPSPDDLLQENERVFSHFALDEAPPPGNTWAAARYADYGRTWTLLAKAFEQLGNAPAASTCFERAQAFKPRMSSP